LVKPLLKFKRAARRSLLSLSEDCKTLYYLKKTGFLAEPFEALSLAAGISWVLNRLEAERNSSTKTDCLQDAASRAAVGTYSTITIGHQHKKEYELAVQNWMNP
jgi:hypothetical protein